MEKSKGMLYNINEIDYPSCAPVSARIKSGRMGEGLMGKKAEIEALIERKCAYCEHGTPIRLSTQEEPDVICEKHGIVPRDHLCRSFRYDLLKREPQKTSPKKSETAVDTNI